MVSQRKPFVAALCGLCVGAVLSVGVSPAHADPGLVPGDGVSFSQGGVDTGTSKGQSSEKKTVHGHRNLPPGYQDAPSMDFQHGDDPDHLAKVQRDPVTGADLSRYGSAYQSSGPFGSGQVGDSTGNGWVTPR